MSSLATRANTREIGTNTEFAIPSWGSISASQFVDTKEAVPELIYPYSVRVTYPRMRNDTQLSGLYRGTTLPIRRYLWGVDPNGSDPAIVEAVCSEFNLPLIEDAVAQHRSGSPVAAKPIGRAQNRFSFDKHLEDALKAIYLGHYWFEQVYDIRNDGPAVNGGLFAHIKKIAPRAPRSVSEVLVDRDGSLVGIKQFFSSQVGHPVPEPIPVSALAAYVFDQDPGDWAGRSMFRSCYREWLLKDELLRVDVLNHKRAGGVLMPAAPKDATAAEIAALGMMAAQFQVGGGGAVPDGTDLNFIRASGADVIGSINRHDEAMAREFLMMFMALGTSSSGGNRALSQSFIDWFGISQEAIGLWLRDTFQNYVVRDFVELNWADVDYYPRLVFVRPEDANPLQDIVDAVSKQPGTPAAITGPGAEAEPLAAVRVGGERGALLVDDDLRGSLIAASQQIDKAIASRQVAMPAALPTAPAGRFRRELLPHELTATTDFKQIDTESKASVDELVQQWQTIRDEQIGQLESLIASAGGDMTALAQLQATAQGGDLIAKHLRDVAATAAQGARDEAHRQGVAVARADLARVEAQLAARAAALEQLLARSLSEAAARRAVALSGGALTPSEVAAETRTSLQALTDTYLTDQFGGAVTAAQNDARLAVMDANGASKYYISALLDASCCDVCAEYDGQEYDTAEAIAEQLPAGGNKDCLGGPRCRCTGIAVYDEAAPSVQ